MMEVFRTVGERYTELRLLGSMRLLSGLEFQKDLLPPSLSTPFRAPGCFLNTSEAVA